MSPAQPFNLRLVVGMIAAGLVAFGALILLLAFGNQIGTPRDGRAHALSGSAVGYKALVAMAERFHDARTVRNSVDRSTADLLVVALEDRNRPEDVTRLLEERRGLPTLLILPKWIVMPDARRRGWVRSLAPGMSRLGERLIGNGVSIRIARDAPGRLAQGVDSLTGLSMPIPASPQVIEGSALVPLVTISGDGALVAQLGEEPHYVISDPDLVNNHGLKTLPAARAALTLLGALRPVDRDGIAFDLTMNGLQPGGDRNLLRSALEPPFLAMTIALLFAALLAGLHGAFRFGQARRPERSIAFGKAALVENSAGLIRLAGREAHLGLAYADVVRHDAARLAAAPPGLQGEALDAYLDRFSRAGAPTFSELVTRIYNARDRHELADAARALFSWKKDIIR